MQAHSADSPSVRPPPARVGSEWIGFLLLGGGTVAIAGILIALELLGLTSHPYLIAKTAKLGTFFAIAAIFVNYPHAIWGYRLAYAQGWSFTRAHKRTLILLPSLLIAGLGYVFTHWNQPIDSLPGVLGMNRSLEYFGIYLNANLYTSSGSFILALLLVSQIVFLGQHYAMQTYGISLHCARSAAYPLDDTQRRWIRQSLVAMWMLNIFSGYTHLSVIRTSGFEYFSPRFPDFLRGLSQLAALSSLLGVIWFVLIQNWRKHRRLPPPAAWGSYVALFFWLQPYWYFAFGYHTWIIQIGHCIQYLYFVFLVERSGFMSEKAKRTFIAPIALTVGIIGVGYLAFEYLPARMDQFLPNSMASIAFFILSASFLINFHHYFIDAIVWRNRNSRIRPILQNIFIKARSPAA